MFVCGASTKYDGRSTYCRVTAQNPLDELLDSDALLTSSKSSEIEVVVSGHDIVQANHGFDVAWTTTLSRDLSKEIQLPSPLEVIIVRDAQEKHYTTVSSRVKMCKREMDCNEYSRTVTVSSAQLSANFTSANTVTFKASRIVVPSTGWYTGFAQVTLAGNDAGSQRYDFFKYFAIYATEEDVVRQTAIEKFADHGSESYCWGVGAGADNQSVDVTNVMFSWNSTNCPYTIKMAASTTTFSVDADVLVNWTVARQTAAIERDEMTVNSTTVYNALTNEYVNLPQANIYYCNGTKCSLFSKNKTLVYSAPATNFSTTSGMAQFSSKLNFPREGTYALMAHAVIPNGDDFRFDVASLMHMTVTAPSTLSSTDGDSSSKIGLILCLTLGCTTLICLIVLGLEWRGRRAGQQAAQQKESRHSFLSLLPLSNNTNRLPTNSLISGHGSEESGHFMYMKAQRSPMDMPRASSLSYDPNSQKSSVESSHEVSGYSIFCSDSELSSIERSYH